eukprot:tig00000658_g2926.t1
MRPAPACGAFAASLAVSLDVARVEPAQLISPPRSPVPDSVFRQHRPHRVRTPDGPSAISWSRPHHAAAAGETPLHSQLLRWSCGARLYPSAQPVGTARPAGILRRSFGVRTCAWQPHRQRAFFTGARLENPCFRTLSQPPLQTAPVSCSAVASAAVLASFAGRLPRISIRWPVALGLSLLGIVIDFSARLWSQLQPAAEGDERRERVRRAAYGAAQLLYLTQLLGPERPALRFAAYVVSFFVLPSFASKLAAVKRSIGMASALSASGSSRAELSNLRKANDAARIFLEVLGAALAPVSVGLSAFGGVFGELARRPAAALVTLLFGLGLPAALAVANAKFGAAESSSPKKKGGRRPDPVEQRLDRAGHRLALLGFRPSNSEQVLRSCCRVWLGPGESRAGWLYDRRRGIVVTEASAARGKSEADLVDVEIAGAWVSCRILGADSSRGLCVLCVLQADPSEIPLLAASASLGILDAAPEGGRSFFLVDVGGLGPGEAGPGAQALRFLRAAPGYEFGRPSSNRFLATSAPAPAPAPAKGARGRPGELLGAPIANEQGEVVGTLVLSGESGIALSSAEVARVAELFCGRSAPSDPFLGVDLEEVELAPAPAPGQAVGVSPGSPAEAAGVRRGDVLVGMDGLRVSSRDALGRLVRTRPAPPRPAPPRPAPPALNSSGL